MSQVYRGPDETKIKQIFQAVAPQYDRTNDVITGGLHRLWRRRLLSLSKAKAGDHVLDCATGTGDLAIEFKKVVGPEGRVVGTDFCREMIELAPEKARKQDVDVVFEEADVTKLPYEDMSFDVCSIGFGIRNVSDPLKGLTEMARVTRPEGKTVVLETGHMDNPVLAPFFKLYTRNILPLLGGFMTGHKDAYDYLQSSSNQFPSRSGFTDMMEQTGLLKDCQCEPLIGGAAYIYHATRK